MNERGYYQCPGCPLRMNAMYDEGDQTPYAPGMSVPPTHASAPEMSVTPPYASAPEMSVTPPYASAPEMPMTPTYASAPAPTYPAMSVMPSTPAMPYYQMPGYPQMLWQEMESERDMQKLKEMYPNAARDILPYIEEECDKMEYDGSMMFDEYPDRVMTRRVRDRIYDQVKDRYELPKEDDREEILAMNRETRKRYPMRENWLGDLIDVLLFQEMHRRRCRRRNCKSFR